MIRKLVNRLGYDVVRYPNRRGFEYHLSQLFDFLQIDTVLDVGANHGQYATSLRSLGYAGWIYSYEPVKSIFDSLSARMAGDDCGRRRPGEGPTLVSTSSSTHRAWTSPFFAAPATGFR